MDDARRAAAARSLPAGYSDWLADTKDCVVAARQRAVLAVNIELVQLYWQIGRDILQRQAAEGWDNKVVDRLGQDLCAAFSSTRGFSPRNLNYMRVFAEAWPDDKIVQKHLAQLPWSHNVLLLTMLKDPAERLHYAEQAVSGGWSRSTLEANIRDRRKQLATM